jgi:hypothetical protein
MLNRNDSPDLPGRLPFINGQDTSEVLIVFVISLLDPLSKTLPRPFSSSEGDLRKSVPAHGHAQEV